MIQKITISDEAKICVEVAVGQLPQSKANELCDKAKDTFNKIFPEQECIILPKKDVETNITFIDIE